MAKFMKVEDSYYIKSRRDYYFKKFKSLSEINEYIKDPKNSIDNYPIKEEDEYLCKLYGDVDNETFFYDVPSGFYRWMDSYGSSPEKLVTIKTKNEYIIDLLNGTMKWDTMVEDFISKFPLYNDLKIIPRRNVLLYGKPGCGKSTKIRQLAQKLIDNHKAIVVYVDGVMSEQMCQALNELPNLKIIIFEEVGNTIENRDVSVESLLQWLDGEYVLNNSVTILTTNHPEKLPENLIRFGRVDYMEEISELSEQDRRNVLEFYLKEEATDAVIKATKDMIIADLKEVCIKIRVEKLDYLQAIEDVKTKNKTIKKNFSKPTQDFGLNVKR